METLLKIRQRVREDILSINAIAQVLSGNVDRDLYARYLTHVWHYAQHSATVIGLAGARCVAKHPVLADYLLRHAQEELGHEQWALQDLAALHIGEHEVRASRPVPACAAMIGYEYYIAAHANPVGLFGWLYVLEAMGEDLGRRVSDSVQQGLGIHQGVKFLKGHGDADEVHTRDLTQMIGLHIEEPDLADVHFVAAVVGDLYVRMLREIAEPGPLSRRP